MTTAVDTRPKPQLIRARNLSMSYDAQRIVLNEISCDIAKGEFVAILGPSGCGKSTFLRLVAGLVRPTSGSLEVDDQSPEAARRSSQRMAFVFQEPHLLPWRTVAGNIALPLEINGVSQQKRASAVNESLSLIGLTDEDADKQPRRLSGGMRMRVSLARALVTNPDLLLLDEPFAALDDVLRQQMNEELAQLWGSQRWTGLFVTHNVAEAVFLSQRILVMSPRPGTILANITIPFDYPRKPALRANPEFAVLCHELSRQLRGEVR